MAEIKEYVGTTPSYTVVFYDPSGALIDPTTFTKIEVLVYNFKKGKDDGIIATFTTETPKPAESIELTVTGTQASFTIPETSTGDVYSGDNLVEVWITDGDNKDCIIGILNEFINPEDGV
jgi:hypothetical protein